MIIILKTLLELIVGIGIAATVLAILLPLLIKAGYLTIGSQAGIWIIGIVIVASVVLTMFRPWRVREGSDTGTNPHV